MKLSNFNQQFGSAASLLVGTFLEIDLAYLQRPSDKCLHRRLVNHFVQKSAQNNQNESHKNQQKVFLDLHRNLPSKRSLAVL